ncbi:MAG: hypothetical protein L0216_08350 [Planctomycetales bacterium]|nr:hypothetical protein [Planctomycetales bacterium]
MSDAIGTGRRLSYRNGGGCLILFGLPFLVPGLLVATSPLWGEMTTESGEAAPVFFVVPFGLLFTAVGAGFVFGRSGAILDKDEGTATSWWGLLVPFRRTVRPLADFREVAVVREIRRSKNSTYTVFVVRLAGAGKPLDLREPRDPVAARRLAEEAAGFLGLPVRDTTGERPLVREAARLDEPLRERLRRTGERAPRPAPPLETPVGHEIANDGATLEMPAPGLRAALVLPLLIGAAISAVVLFAFVHPVLAHVAADEREGAGVALALFSGPCVAVGLAPLALVGLPFLRAARTRDRVGLSRTGVRVERRGLLLSKAIEMEASEVEEVGIAKAEGRPWKPLGGEVVAIRCDDGTVEIGAGLPKRDLEWLRDLARHYLGQP